MELDPLEALICAALREYRDRFRTLWHAPGAAASAQQPSGFTDLAGCWLGRSAGKLGFSGQIQGVRRAYSSIPWAREHEYRRAQETSRFTLEAKATGSHGRLGQMWTDAGRAQQISGFAQETSGMLAVMLLFLTAKLLC